MSDRQNKVFFVVFFCFLGFIVCCLPTVYWLFVCSSLSFFVLRCLLYVLGCLLFVVCCLLFVVCLFSVGFFFLFGALMSGRMFRALFCVFSWYIDVELIDTLNVK